MVNTVKVFSTKEGVQPNVMSRKLRAAGLEHEVNISEWLSHMRAKLKEGRLASAIEIKKKIINYCRKYDLKIPAECIFHHNVK